MFSFSHSRFLAVAGLAVLAAAVPTTAAIVIVDNSAAGFRVNLGTWNTGAFGVPWGADYRWTSAVTGTATAEVEWRPTIPKTGTYEVAVWYVAGANRATNAAFMIDHSFGTDTMPVNQQINGSRWVVLGQYSFSVGTWGRVRLNNSATPAGNVVIADAVRFRMVSSDFNLDGHVDASDFDFFSGCYNGPTNLVSGDCIDADLNNDEYVDAVDFDAFSGCYNGPVNAMRCREPDPIPARPANAITGSQFITQVTGLSLTARDPHILQEITSGNMPEFLREFCPINVSTTARNGMHYGTYFVTPDYLAVGSNQNFVRMPMMPGTAQQIADQFQCILPTRKMVNDIYAQAGVKLEPYPFNPQYYDITSLAIFVQHNTVIEQQRAGYPLGPIVGGIKKDVVLTNLLIGNSDRVAIYGWHRLNGTPIQPLYIGHNYLHVDYSHGIRLVKQKMIVDGQEMFITDVLRDANLCPMISDEGAITFLRY